VGKAIEHHPRFPNRTNVEFVEEVSPHHLKLRVWERGAGWTLACGSGACATAVAALLLGKVKSPVQIELPGGSLEITWDPKNPKSSVLMKGPATEVFRAEWPLT
jgi:diaminopimelate epimerase